ncbi:nucleotidyltransferase family protein [Microlunatus parietis]|uniref:Putative nucleotidyltransferase n=1 Tax=Microlunatus parietis TaxID=682979 RepID=A0A7Y9LCL5_9ACTN|nr:nucleotidyltransferase domain-containing protein [Microlunatus parietis]NYE72962.1 putative nucleotidyltransferase [Microlunatus parietis]
MGSEDVRDVARRAELAEAVIARLAGVPGVVGVRPFGSLASGRADAYSDIDLVVELDGVSDLTFAQEIPDHLAPLGRPLITGWGLDRLPDTYVRTIYLADYPLFWHLDIGSAGPLHEADADLGRRYHWPQIFKMWIAAVKDQLRGRPERTADFLRHIAAWADLSRLSGPDAVRLGQSLELCVERARARGAPCAEIYRRCAELRATHVPGWDGT